MLTTFLDDAVIRNSLDAGAKAYVYKDVEGRDLKRAIRTVANGEAVIHDKAAARVMQWARSGSSRDPVPLSRREVDVLRHVARGRTNGEIAAELDISINTVKTCLNRALRKLGCHSRTQAAALAAKRGLL
jgi:DNA-binding NarL/FixJ family response regulator